MAIISLKRTEAEQKNDTSQGVGLSENAEEYFYGLRVSLEEPELEKLGLKPEVGKEIKIEGVVKIVSYSEEENGRRAELLITDLGTPGSEDGGDRESVMYPGS